MWRRARGRLAIVVALGAAMLSRAPAGDGCALGSSGRIKCWRSPVRGAWEGVYRSLVGSGTRLCALTVDGRVECDREWPFLKP